MEGEDIKTFVNRDEVLVAGSKEAGNRSQSADQSRDIDRDCLKVSQSMYEKFKPVDKPNPAAGVIPTRPEMIPEQKPRILNFRSKA